jgi:hypothetical protein
MALQLAVLSDHLAVCRLQPQAAIPEWAIQAAFFSVTRTSDELSIVCPEQQAPVGIQCERGWRAVKIEGPFAFDETGILAAVADPLALAGVGILAIATYDTDYVLVKETQLAQAISVLRQHGHGVREHG